MTDKKNKNIKEFIGNILKLFWQKLFLVLLLFLVLDLIIGTVFFFNHYLSVQERGKSFFLPLKINQTLANNFLKNFQEREKLFKTVSEKYYPNLFSGPGTR
jgi:hypothetical protein